MKRKRCPVCNKLFKNVRSHFSALTWNSKGVNRKLSNTKNAIKHRKWFFTEGNNLQLMFKYITPEETNK